MDGVVDGHAVDAAVGGEHPRLRLDLLRREHPLDRREQRIAVEQLQISRELLDAVVAVEIKRRGEIDGVEQLTRYLELLNRDPLLAPVKGVFAAQEIKPQARVLAADRGIDCVTVDYAVLKGTDDPSARLF